VSGAAIDGGERCLLVLDQFGSRRPIGVEVLVHPLVLDVRRQHVRHRVAGFPQPRLAVSE
jgi:hypothetical protein